MTETTQQLTQGKNTVVITGELATNNLEVKVSASAHYRILELEKENKQLKNTIAIADKLKENYERIYNIERGNNFSKSYTRCDG